MAIYYGPSEKSNILSRLNGIYMGSPTKEVNWNDFGMAADVWVGGFNTGMTCKGFTGVKDNIDNYFAAPTKITLNGDQTLFVGDSYRSEIKLDSNTYDFSKLTWASSNPAVATVDGTGVVTATTTTGETTITATYGEISSSYKVTVTNDVAYKIVLDGNRDEEIWQVAKTKPLYLTRDGNNYEDFYAIKTGRGILIGADLYTKDQHIAGEWFKGDNFEFRFSVDGKMVAEMDNTILIPEIFYQFRPKPVEKKEEK